VTEDGLENEEDKIENTNEYIIKRKKKYKWNM
jgi:hypothetical protein